ncbi:MAG: anti-phage BREX system Lon protease BrxL [Acidovorax sp.]|nr:anti-phage BREX system Lon protease BrxL [Acidovorax sp.]
MIPWIARLRRKPCGGYIVRKDLVRQFSRQFPVPTYVVEFMLGRYCATTNDQAEIQEGLDIVQRQLMPNAHGAGGRRRSSSRPGRVKRG